MFEYQFIVQYRVGSVPLLFCRFSFLENNWKQGGGILF